ncbi:atrial natriuretic peptide receptor 1-like [Paramacrobiotus metropolitanus]|uniref:atrial natriuretic peptide receptor 1-like n=1 Tax=Paramacrobiotus metropolitanus TaxID=2943436 RepID=UPI002445F70E|nr:atrial natriuretic peptide receptor 1-like [Paramacrobiotus metropolitanus]
MEILFSVILNLFLIILWKIIFVSGVAPINETVPFQNVNLSNTLNVEIISVGNYYPTSISSNPYAGPGLDLGIVHLRDMFAKSSPVVNFKHTYVYDRKYRFCGDITDNVDRMTAEYYYNRQFLPNITAFIAPGCTERINLSKLIRGWNSLMMVGGNGEIIFRNKALFPNVILAGENAIKSYTTYFAALLRKFNWSTVYIISDQSAKPFHALLAPNLHASLKEQKDFRLTFSRTGGPDLPTFDSVLADIRQSSRIVVFLGYAAVLRTFMLKAQKAGMTDGDYVYFALEPFKHSDYGNLTWKYNDKDDEDARRSFQSLLIVTSANNYLAEDRLIFYNQLKDLSYSRYNFTYAVNEVPNPFVTASTESMIMFGTVLQEMIAEYPLPKLSDGSAMAKRFWNRTFTLSDPYSVTIAFDDVGERKQLLVTQQFIDNFTDRTNVAVYNETSGNVDILTNIRWPIAWPPPNEPFCGYLGLDVRCRSAGTTSFVLTSAISVIACMMIIILVTVGILRYLRPFSQDLYRWLLLDADVQLAYTKTACSHMATYHGDSVWATWTGVEIRPALTVDALKVAHNDLFATFADIDHRNINCFIGVYLENNRDVWFLSTWNRRGSLDRLLSNVDSPIADWDFKVCLVSDLLEGLCYIHQSPAKYHGSLSAHQCLLDPHFTLVIGSLGYDRMITALTENPVQEKGRTRSILGKLFSWTHAVKSSTIVIWQQNDIKAFKDIVFQICFPIRLVQDKALDQQLSRKAAQMYKFQEILVDTPTPSLNLEDIRTKFRQLFGKRNKNVVENLLAKTTSYAETLEEIVGSRTLQLKSERQKADDLLSEILPRTIVNALRNKQDVRPEDFDSVTFAFSDLPGFVTWSSQAAAASVIELLSRVYVTFDEETARFDVYKVETVGDTYVVASGLPIRNGDQHALEICQMAKCFLSRSKALDLERDNMRLRVGIHSGACAAGVIGNILPRYCVFGDVVNTASRMETTGEPGKIHASSNTAKLIPLGQGIIKIPRGIIDVKGKGQMQTYWIA